MSSKLEALDELAKAISKLKGEKFKSRKPVEAEVVVESEDLPVDPEAEVELDEECEDEEDNGEPKGFSKMLESIAKKKNKKH